jgi:hypothetical protein
MPHLGLHSLGLHGTGYSSLWGELMQSLVHGPGTPKSKESQKQLVQALAGKTPDMPAARAESVARQ